MEYIFEALKILAPLLIGGWIGSKFNIINDKRKEYNEYVEPLYLCLNSFYLNINHNNIPKLYIDKEVINLALIKINSKHKEKLKYLLDDLCNHYEENRFKWVTYPEGLAIMKINDDDLNIIKNKTKVILDLINLK